MKITDILIGILIATMWGSAFVVIELGLREFPPIFNASLRFAVASLPFLAFVPRNGIAWRWIFTIGMTFVFMFAAMYIGMRVGMPAGLTSLVLQAQVLFTVLLAPYLLKEHATGWQKIGVSLGVVGIALIATDMPTTKSLTALLLVVVAAFFYGMISLWMKMAKVGNMLSLIVWVSLIPPLPLLLLSLAFESGQWNSVTGMSAMGAFSVFYTAAIGTVIPFALWGRLLKRYSAHVVAPFALLIPVIGMGSAAVFLDERFSDLKLLSSLLIIGGLVTILWGRRLYQYVRPPRNLATARASEE